MQPGQYQQGQFPSGQEAPGWNRGPAQGYSQQQSRDQYSGGGGYPGYAYPQPAYPQNWDYQQAPEAQRPYASGFTGPGMAAMQQHQQMGWNPQAQNSQMPAAQMSSQYSQPHAAQKVSQNMPMSNPQVDLSTYLEDCTENDKFADVRLLEQLVRAGGPEGCNVASDEGYSPLHLLVMLGAASPSDAVDSISVLLQGGASINALDPDGENALEATLSIAADSDDDEDDDESRIDDHNQGRPDKKARQLIRAAFMQVLIQHMEVDMETDQLQRMVAFSRKHQPMSGPSDVLGVLKKRLDPKKFNQVWESEELLEYLQDCCYEKSCGADPAIVAKHLSKGAWANYQPKDGVGALHLVALNPYHEYTQVREVTRLLVKSDPKCCEVRDRFKLTALQWAEDYMNLAKQHDLNFASPATLVAFSEMLPDSMDSGLVCVKPGSTNWKVAGPESLARRPSLRFAEGERVKALVAVPGGRPEWEEGVVVGLWLRNEWWPKKHYGAPYEVLLDLGTRVLCLADRPDLIRAEKDKAPTVRKPETKAAAEALQAPAPKKVAKRFEKRKRPDGKWELLDSKTGNAKIIPTPDTSDED